MCGFAGIVDFAAAVDPAELDALDALVAGRGPDGQGRFVSPDACVGLVHRRLAIVDLPGGAQPMSNEQATIWLVFNGEIYNHLELRAELSAAGHRFRTHCDTEAILHGYEQFGPRCVERLRGQFAFALVDLPRRRVLLARDRLGQKPLYYHLDEAGVLRFSSLPLPDQRRRPGGRQRRAYLARGYLGWRGRQVRPGGLVQFDADSRQARPSLWWQLPLATPRFAGSPAEAARELRRRLVEATDLRLRADVEVALFLSGGIDSAVIASIVRRELGRPIRTFTIGTPDPAYDERPAAERVALELGAQHEPFEVQPDHLLDVLDELIATTAEPFADSSIVPTHWVARLARPHVKVALSGDGGDEAFAGYDRYRAARLARRLRAGRSIVRLTRPLWRRFDGGQMRSGATRLVRFLGQLGQPLPMAYRHWVGLFSDEQLARVLRPDAQPGVAADDPDDLATLFAGEWDATGDPVQAASRTDYQSYLPGDVLTKVDRASMQVALEVRSPLLDHRVVEWAVSLPSDFKLRGRTSKWILRQAFADIVPACVWTQPKRGFGLPLDRWFRRQLLGLLRESVASLPGELFDAAAIESLIADHAAGRAEHSQRLWALLWLGRWWKRFVG